MLPLQLATLQLTSSCCPGNTQFLDSPHTWPAIINLGRHPEVGRCRQRMLCSKLVDGFVQPGSPTQSITFILFRQSCLLMQSAGDWTTQSTQTQTLPGWLFAGLGWGRTRTGQAIPGQAMLYYRQKIYTILPYCNHVPWLPSTFLSFIEHGYQYSKYALSCYYFYVISFTVQQVCIVLLLIPLGYLLLLLLLLLGYLTHSTASVHYPVTTSRLSPSQYSKYALSCYYF